MASTHLEGYILTLQILDVPECSARGNGNLNPVFCHAGLFLAHLVHFSNSSYRFENKSRIYLVLYGKDAPAMGH